MVPWEDVEKALAAAGATPEEIQGFDECLEWLDGIDVRREGMRAGMHDQAIRLAAVPSSFAIWWGLLKEHNALERKRK